MKKITKKYGFTLSCKSFRSRLLRALLPQLHRKTLANQVSQVSLAHTSHSLRMQAHTKSKDFGSLCNSYGFSQKKTDKMSVGIKNSWKYEKDLIL